MQITVKSTKVAKTGTNKNGPWELIVVATEEGLDYTTFNTGVKHLAPGTVIALDEITIKGDAKSFKEYKVVSAPSPSEVKPNGNGMTPELWAEKDKLDRISLEGRVAMECMTEAVIKFVIEAENDADLIASWKKALKAKLDAFVGIATELKPTAKLPPPEKETESLPDGEEPTFANNGELMTYLKDHGIDSTQVITTLSINSPRDIKDPNEAFKQFKHLIKPPDEGLLSEQ